MIAVMPQRAIVWRPLAITLLLHGLLIFLLTLNWQTSSEVTVKPTVKPRYIEARLIDAEQLKPKKKPRPKTNSKPRPTTPATAKPKPVVKAKPALSKPKPKATPEPVVKTEPEPARPTAAERAAAARAELALAMAEEDEYLEEASDAQITASYVALIARVIEENWSRPPSARNEMEAELVIQLIPTGEVVSVSVASTSGQLAFDRSAVMAVQKAERFPELQDLPSRIFERNFRRLRLKFKPEDLRY